MSRQPRVVAVGRPHHVAQYTNRREALLSSPETCRLYLEALAAAARKHGLEVWAYALLPDHVHLIAVPRRAEALGDAMRDAHAFFAMALNRRANAHGHVWQARFYSCPLEDVLAPAAIRYVESNPVRCGLADESRAYSWSSAAARAGLQDDAEALSPLPFEIADAATAGEEREIAERIRRCTRTGRPCGGPAFLAQLGRELGRTFAEPRRGRPRKSVKEDKPFELDAPRRPSEDGWRNW